MNVENHASRGMSALSMAQRRAIAFLQTLQTRPVAAPATFAELVAALGGPLPDEGEAAEDVVEHLAGTAERGVVATPGPRYFGFVTGGTLPAALAADWLTSAWDQNAALEVMSPFSAAVEHVTAGWLLDVLALPRAASVGFVTGATMANVTALAAARHEVLRRGGWDVEADGLQGAPRVTVVAGAEAHSSLLSALRLIGFGTSTIVRAAADDQGRMTAAGLNTVLQSVDGPLIVCAQAGNVNTGAFDPLGAIVPLVRARGGWLHVDGAFGLWAAASRALRHHAAGAGEADSWAVDGHKWLNVPYDSGFAIVAHPAAHRAAMSQTAAYLLRAADEARDGMDWTPEASRRARANAAYAALGSLGRRGLEAMIDRCCACARVIADRLRAEPGVEVLNDVVLNQVLVRITSRRRGNVTAAVLRRVQQEGALWAGGTSWRGEAAMRISVSGWQTGEADAAASAEAICCATKSVALE